MAHSAKVLTASQFAKLQNKSIWATRRMLRAGKVPNASKVGNRWVIVLTSTQLRGLKRRFVDLEYIAARRISTIPFGQEAGSDIESLRVQVTYARESLLLLGAGDLLLAIGHAKLWRGRQDKYGKNIFAQAQKEIDRLVAA